MIELDSLDIQTGLGKARMEQAMLRVLATPTKKCV